MEGHEEVPAQVQEGSVALLAELVVVFGVHPAHGLDHLLAELHGRRQRLWVAAQDVPEVDVEQRARARQQQVVQVPVAHTCRPIKLLIYIHTTGALPLGIYKSVVLTVKLLLTGLSF
jgi:hypothetical protein